MELLTVPEAAQRLKLSKSKVYLLCQRGEIPTVTLGRSVRIPLDALDEWLRHQLRPAPGASVPPSPEWFAMRSDGVSVPAGQPPGARGPRRTRSRPVR
jgi:excisionase family DNA binding protein